MENAFVRLRFDGQGRLRGVYDKRPRDVLAPGRLAISSSSLKTRWPVVARRDIDIFYNDKPIEFVGPAVEVAERGPVRSVLHSGARSGIPDYRRRPDGGRRASRSDHGGLGHEHDVILKAAFP